MKEKPESSSPGWVGRVFRAVLIGAAIYYLWAFSVTCMMRQAITNTGQQETERPDMDPNSWTGHRPPNEADLAVQKGYDWASARDLRSHAACRDQWTDINHDSLVRYGCSKYVTEQNVLKVVQPIPKHDGWDDGTTTAECIAEVKAYWDPVVKDMLEKGEHHVAASRLERDVNPLIRQCANFDNVRINRVIYQPQLRINAILDKVKNGKFLTHSDKQTVQKDYPGVWNFPDNQYRTQYLNSANEFFRIVGGRDQVLSGEDEAMLNAAPGRP